jgi:hypothetical protein
MVAPAVEAIETTEIETELQKLHDSDPVSYKAALEVEAAAMAKLQPLLASSTSVIIKDIVAGLATAFADSAASNGVTL